MSKAFPYCVSLALTLVLPAVAAAQETIRGILGIAVNILTAVIPAIMVLTLLFFIWGAIKLIYFGGDEKSRGDAKASMVWGTLALFVMVCVWGLVQIIKVTFFGDI